MRSPMTPTATTPIAMPPTATTIATTLMALLVLGACGVTTSHGDAARPRDLAIAGGGFDLTTGQPGSDGGVPVDDCSEQAKLVYVVDSDNRFSSFKPDTLQFQDIGRLSCPAAPLATPFSMAVDRNAVAWVLYSSGELFQVDTMTAKCTATKFARSQQGFDLFGMGFVSNAMGSTDETLFIAGGPEQDVGISSTLGTIDTTTLLLKPIAPVDGSPELTGTGDAKLWGFFPDNTSPRVAQLDKASAGTGKTFPLGALAGTPSAWAFAHWGGDFWIFLKRSTDSSTIVWHLQSANGQVTKAIPSTGRTIVGAGVSTCAPIQIG